MTPDRAVDPLRDIERTFATRRKQNPCKTKDQPMRRTTVLLALTATTLSVAVAPAGAARTATPEEAAAIVGDRSVPAECYTVTVSTVDPTWAVLRNAPNPDPDACYLAGNGMAIARLANGVWTTAPGDSDEGTAPSCATIAVPTDVGVDLGVCSAPVPHSKTTVTCWGSTKKVKGEYRTKRLVRRRPRTCSTLFPGASFSEGSDLRSLRWKRWGSSTAIAIGVLRPWHGNSDGSFDRIRARVVLSGAVESNGKRWYTRMKITTRYGTGRSDLRPPYEPETYTP
jgi:hypothetical protein